MFSHTVTRYIFVGLVNTLVGLFSIYVAKWFFLLSDITSNAVGYSIGLLVSFLLNRNWTFKFNGSWIPSIIRYLLVLIIAYGSNLIVVILVIEYVDVSSYVAQAVGIIPYTLIFYFGSKWYVFNAAMWSGK